MILHGRLRIIVLHLLSKKSMTGNELRNSIKEMTGSWTPSPGSMYPLLSKLSENELVSIKHDANKKIYSLTEKGYELIKSFNESKKKIKEEMIGAIDLVKELGDRQNIEEIKRKILENDFCNLNNFELGNLYELIQEKNKIESNQQKIQEILNEAMKKISEL